MKNNQEILKYSLLFFLLVAIDQATKFYVREHQTAIIFRNYDFAFSLVLPQALMYLIYLLLIVLLGFWFFKKVDKKAIHKLSFVLILAGALSNVVERIASGYVIDFIHIHTGVLNLADFFILMGVGLLIFI